VGISLVHTLLELLLLGSMIRTATYLILAQNPDSLLGKWLAFAY
jgi:hypothetical protein